MPFSYLEAEGMIVRSEKAGFFSSTETRDLVPPRLKIQLWDDDVISRDDQLGKNLKFF